MTFRKIISESLNLKFPTKLNDVECLVFSTSLQNKKEVMEVAGSLNNEDKIIEWSVDLEDWEKVLRVVSKGLTAEQIIKILFDRGVTAKEMEV